jgi:hypothetical protein
MTAEALNIPDDSSELSAWLERQMVSGDLAALVAQLEAVHQSSDRLNRENGDGSSALDQILGASREAVITQGISALDREQIGRLLVQPKLLMELQERAFEYGASYWQQRAGEAQESQQDVADQRRRLWRHLTTPDAISIAAQPQVVSLARRDLLIGLTSAAAVLIGVFAYQRLAPRTPEPQSEARANVAWGWLRPGALPETGTKQAYLMAVADSAHEWFDRQPASAEELAVRIGQLRQGCSTLILAPHKPLAEADRAWLRERCQAWAKKFDEQLAAVEAGSDFATVRAETDATVNKLIGALRARAAETPASS